MELSLDETVLNPMLKRRTTELRTWSTARPGHVRCTASLASAALAGARAQPTTLETLTMSFAAYQSFIDQFCEQAGLPEPRAMYHDAAFRIGNTDFTLRHGGANAPEMAMIYCALGGLPPAGPQREAALMGLLDSNLQLFGSGSNPTFAFNADNQQAMLMCGIWLGQASGLSVLELLTRFDMLAHEWRSSYFVGGQLNADGTPQTAASRSQRGLPPHLARAFNAGQVA